MNCIFCEIVARRTPCYKIYEDENYLGFLDIYPKTSYQMLVIPKKHTEWVWDVPNLGSFYEVVGKVALNAREVLKVPIRQMVYGFEVPHAHIQIRPGKSDDRDGSALSTKEAVEWSKKLSLI